MTMLVAAVLAGMALTAGLVALMYRAERASVARAGENG
jgi:hypothetical protein